MTVEAIKQSFIERIKQGQLNHAYIFSGDNTSDKQIVVATILQALTCENLSTQGVPCGVCIACERIKSQQFADFTTIEPESRNIKVDQIRELRYWLNRSAVEGHFKMVVIQQAELMNTAASNALLTILEEPKSEVYIILNVTDASALLPTIRSRAQQIVFLNRNEAVFEGNATNSKATVLNALSSTTKNILSQIEEDELVEWMKALNEFYKAILTKNPMSFALIQTRMKIMIQTKNQKSPWKNTQKLECGIEYLAFLTHYKLTHTAKNMPSAVTIHWLDELSVPTARLLNISQQLMEAKKYLLANVSVQMILERLVLNLTM